MPDTRKRTGLLIAILLLLLLTAGWYLLWQTPPAPKPPALEAHLQHQAHSDPGEENHAASADEPPETQMSPRDAPAEPVVEAATTPSDEAAQEAEDEAESFCGTVAGRVVDYSGNEVADADVHVQYAIHLRAEFESSTAMIFTHNKIVRADSRGVYDFEVTDPRPGHTLFAIVQHYATPTGKTVHAIFDQSVFFPLRHGEHRGGVRLEVHDGPFINEEAVTIDFTAQASGRVVDERGVGIADAEVHFSYFFENPALRWLGRLYERGEAVRTDAGGGFTFAISGKALQPPGAARLIVRASRDGYAEGDGLRIRDLKHGEHREGLELVLLDAGSAAGRLLDANREPAAGVSVSAVWTGNNQPPVRAVSATTGEQGRFQFEGLRGGTWRLEATQREPTRTWRLVEFEVQPGIETQLPDAVLVKPGPPKPQTTARARVLLDGEPLKRGTQIELLVEQDRPGYWNRSEHRVGEDGVVVLSSLQPGTLEARISVPGRDIDEYRLTMHLLEGQENTIGEIRLRWAAGKVE